MASQRERKRDEKSWKTSIYHHDLYNLMTVWHTCSTKFNSITIRNSNNASESPLTKRHLGKTVAQTVPTISVSKLLNHIWFGQGPTRKDCEPVSFPKNNQHYIILNLMVYIKWQHIIWILSSTDRSTINSIQWNDFTAFEKHVRRNQVKCHV